MIAVWRGLVLALLAGQGTVTTGASCCRHSPASGGTVIVFVFLAQTGWIFTMYPFLPLFGPKIAHIDLPTGGTTSVLLQNFRKFGDIFFRLF